MDSITPNADIQAIGLIDEQLQEATENLLQQQRRLSSLLRITHVASSTLSMEEVLYTISQEIINAIGAWGCNSFLFPERSQQGYYYLIDPKPSADYKVPDPPDRFTLEALETAKPVFTEDVMSDPRTDKRTMGYFGIKSALAFPLVFQGRAVAAGFSCFAEHHVYTDEEIEIVMAIANAGAMAVANAKLHNTAVLLAIAQERNLLAQEMHDSACQSLASIKLGLNALLISEQLNSSTIDKISEIKDLVDESYNDLRDTIHSFRATGVTTGSFIERFKGYTESFENRYGITVRYHLADEDVALLSQAVLLQLGRILGEALNNVRKHASANSVSITSSNDGDTVTIVIEDDGIGINDDALRVRSPEHFGLSIMEERARDAGGSFTVQRMEPRGTRITVEIPYR